MKKKTISILCSLALLSSLAGCVQNETQQKESPPSESESSTESESGDISAENTGEPPSAEVTTDDSAQETENPSATVSPSDSEGQDINTSGDSSGDSLIFHLSTDSSAANPQTILEWEGLSVTADYWDSETLTLHLSAQNTSDIPLTIQAVYCSVNDAMQTPDFSLSVEAASSGQGSMSFSQESFSDSGITQPERICFTPVVLDGLDYSTRHIGQKISLQTDLSGEGSVPQGQQLAEQDGIRISYLGVSDTSSWGMDILLCIENHSGKNLSFEATDTLVNDISVNPMFSVTAADGTYAVGLFSLFSEELEEHEIHDIQSLTFSIRVLDLSDYQTIETFENLTPAVS